ncbi:MAG: hypothetical protein IJ677_05090 [Alphaproteobacteria bacterium]|nr:hypothetical protein [Alphaproteobacteria bacterium]
MNLLKSLILCTVICSLSSTYAYALLGDGVDTRTVSDLYVPAPEDIANVQLYSNKEIAYMVENYSTPELAKVAIQLNKAQIEAAKMNGSKPPARLTKEILTDKEKIADYLRSQYKFSY